MSKTVLAEKRTALRSELATVEQQIAACDHEWANLKTETVEMRTEITDATGGTYYFGKVQQRTCVKCGITQERLHHHPKSQWTEWGEPTFYLVLGRAVGRYGDLLRKVVDLARPNGLNGQCKVIPTDLVDEIRAALDSMANTKGT